MNDNTEGAAAPETKDEESFDEKMKEVMNVPNNFDHMVISGLMEGTFSGPFEMDFEGNHTLIIGSSGMCSLYRSSRTSPVTFIAKGAKVDLRPNVDDFELVVSAVGQNSEMVISIIDISGISAVPVDGKWLSIEKGILEGVYSLPTKIGKKKLARILVGSNTVSTLKGSPENLRLFGRFTRLGVSAVVDEIDEAIQEGYLEVSEGQFPTLSISEKGIERMTALRNELGVVDLAFGITELTDEEKKFTEALRNWRADAAKEANVPQYIVLRNDAIRNIVKDIPADLEALSDISGVGPSTLEKYGTDILEVLSHAKDSV